MQSGICDKSILLHFRFNVKEKTIMASLVVKALLALKDVVPEPIYNCNEISPRYKYVDGKRTDEISGYVYTATDIKKYTQIHVLVEQKKPLMTPEKLAELQAADQNVFIEFENAVVKPYYSERTKTIEDSIKADGVSLAKNN